MWRISEVKYMNSQEITFNAPTWTHIETLTVQLYKSLKNEYQPDVIAGISRGGLVPARIISDLFLIEGKKPTLSIMQIGFYSGIGKTEKEPIIYQDLPGLIHGKKILLIDDVADSGISLDFAMKYLAMKKPKEVRIATLYYKPWSQIKPDYYIEETEAWIIFPHERYEFMAEQMRQNNIHGSDLEDYLINKIGLPKSSVRNFMELI